MARNTFIDLGYFDMPVAYPAAGDTAVGGPVPDLSRLNGRFIFFLDLPAIPASSLPNGDSYTYNLISSNSPSFGTIDQSVEIGSVTGAGGNGSPATLLAIKPSQITGGEFLTLQIVASSGTTPPSDTGGSALPQNQAWLRVAAW
jgi:hypothetical protein